jgi:hypothetical protein
MTDKVKEYIAATRTGKTSAADLQLRKERSIARKSVKQAILNALDVVGNEAFFISLARGNGEDRRCFAHIAAKLVPLEIQGTLENVHIHIVKQEISAPMDASVRRALTLPAAPSAARVPEEEPV